MSKTSHVKHPQPFTAIRDEHMLSISLDSTQQSHPVDIWWSHFSRKSFWLCLVIKTFFQFHLSFFQDSCGSLRWWLSSESVVMLKLYLPQLYNTVCLCRSGLLLLAKTLDREITDHYTLTVTASDGKPDGVRLWMCESQLKIYNKSAACKDEWSLWHDQQS